MCINSSLRDLKTNIPHVFLADDCVHSSLVNYPLQNDASKMGLPVRKVLKLHVNLKYLFRGINQESIWFSQARLLASMASASLNLLVIVSLNKVLIMSSSTPTNLCLAGV